MISANLASSVTESAIPTRAPTTVSSSSNSIPHVTQQVSAVNGSHRSDSAHSLADAGADTDSAIGDEIQETPSNSEEFSGGGRSNASQLPRQVTFGFVPANVRSNAANDAGDEDVQYSTRWPSWLDGSAVCYFFIAGFMIGVGLTITILTLTQSEEQKKKTKSKGGSSDVVVWIVGPVFICSGLLVCIKAVSHIYRRMHPSMASNNDSGHFLTSDSRPSLNRQNSGLPPCYSAALNAPVPSTVIEEELPTVYLEDENKFVSGENVNDAINENQESLRLVTLNFDPSPPSYDEALDMMRKSLSADFLPQSAQSSSHEAIAFDRRRCTTLGQAEIRKLKSRHVTRSSLPRLPSTATVTSANQPQQPPGSVTPVEQPPVSSVASSFATAPSASRSSLRRDPESFVSVASSYVSSAETTATAAAAGRPAVRIEIEENQSRRE